MEPLEYISDLALTRPIFFSVALVSIVSALSLVLAFGLPRLYDRVLKLTYSSVRVVGTSMLAAIIGLTAYDVIMRKLFHQAVLGANEMVQFMLGIMVFGGFVMVTAHRSHIVVSIFEPLMNRYTPWLYKGLIAGFNLFGIVAITYIAARYAAFQYKFQSATEIHEFEWWQLGVGFVVLASLGILWGIRAATWPRRKGSYVPPAGVITPQKYPISIDLVEGQKYAWCACGRSATQPFCDGSHKGTDFKPIIFTPDMGGQSAICACKRSDNAPYCNGRHNDLRGAEGEPHHGGVL